MSNVTASAWKGKHSPEYEAACSPKKKRQGKSIDGDVDGNVSADATANVVVPTSPSVLVSPSLSMCSTLSPPVIPVSLNDDILHMILRCSDFEELVSAAQASKSLRAKTCNVLDVRLNHMLNRFFTDPKQLRVLLTETDSVISGSFALELIAARATWTCNDLDIYATSAGVDILSSFCEKQGYVTVRPATTANNEAANDEPVTDNDDYASTLATNLGISQIIKFSNGSRKIDLIISNTDCSIYPITYFWNTTLFNFISGSTICSAYPRHIFQHHGQLLPRRAREYRIPRLQEKYEKRGFTFQKCTANEPGYDAGLRRPTRVFGDRLCLITSTTGDCDSGEKQLRARYVLNNLLWSE